MWVYFHSLFRYLPFWAVGQSDWLSFSLWLSANIRWVMKITSNTVRIWWESNKSAHIILLQSSGYIIKQLNHSLSSYMANIANFRPKLMNNFMMNRRNHFLIASSPFNLSFWFEDEWLFKIFYFLSRTTLNYNQGLTDREQLWDWGSRARSPNSKVLNHNSARNAVIECI